MRTTVRLDEQLLREAKRAAVDSGRTLTAVIEDSLRQALLQSPEEGQSRRVSIPSFKGTGLRPGVNLDSNAELLDLMDGR